MYIQVRLLKGFPEPLWYKVPEDWQSKACIGAAVKVSLRNKIVLAMVETISHNKPSVSFAIKSAESLEPFPQDKYYQQFIKQLSYYYQIPEIHFIKRMRQFLVQKELKRQPKEHKQNQSVGQKNEVVLTDEQNDVVKFLLPKVQTSEYTPLVLHGVTGSGKTEIYKKLIEQAIASRKSVLLLLPEVTLAVQFTNLLRNELPHNIPLLSFHSATSIKEKRILWQKLIKGEPILIIGVHLPVLLPIANLGLIIVDEEHEVGYQEKKHPKINSKEAAIMRANLYKIPIVFGSATPSIATLYNVKTKGWYFFQLKKRFAGAFPTIEIVPLNDKKQRKNFWITKQLENALKDRLGKKEQSILFLNRRGYSFFVQCKQCSFIFECANCSVSLTLHYDDYLRCHYCDTVMALPEQCTSCKVHKNEFIRKGIGTQQLVTILEKFLPQARIERADLDTTINKKKWQQTMEDFQQGTIDILVGTQTITKGYHFPNVTLVGILWADLNLHFPVYNAAETTLQQLIQVAGRAGRQRPESLVIVQTMMDHRVFDYLTEIDYLKFYEQELETRTIVNYPPLTRLAEIELKHDNATIIEAEAQSLALLLSSLIKKNNVTVQLLGPALPPVHKVKNIHIRKIYLKSTHINDLITLFGQVNKTLFKSNIFFTPNPLS